MFQNHERFKNLTAGAQSLVIVIAAAVGGWWTYHTFNELGAINTAAAQQAELEQRIRTEPVLQISLSAHPHSTSACNGFLLVDILLANDGKCALELELPEYPLLVSRFSMDNPEVSSWSPVVGAKHVELTKTGTEHVTERLLRTGQRRSVALAVPVTGPGVYLVQFSATYYGAKLYTGEIVRTTDVPIVAFAQTWAAVDGQPSE